MDLPRVTILSLEPALRLNSKVGHRSRWTSGTRFWRDVCRYPLRSIGRDIARANQSLNKISSGEPLLIGDIKINVNSRMAASAAVVTVLLLTVVSAECNAGLFDGCGCQKPDNCINHGCSEPCMLICCPEYKTVKEKTYCWEVDCEHVCVPQVKCPSLLTLLGLKKSSCLSCDSCGQSGCNGECGNGSGCKSGPLCAKIRTVRRLRKVETEVEKQVVEWTVKTCAMDYGKCCTGCAPNHGCGPANGCGPSNGCGSTW